VLPVLPQTEDVQARMRTLEQASRSLGRPIQAFVDVGGAAANVGPGASESIIRPGLSRPRWSPYQASRLGIVGQMALRRVPIIALFDVLRLSRTFKVPWDPVVRPTAKDLPPPPPEPIWLGLVLVGVVAMVVAAHRRGLFRVPDWELPPALRKAMRWPGRDPARDMASATSETH
jgi:hypothetical protein